ncbi:MAG: hypothetical protein MZW92_49625 [Comamonadaceae bacterium]|nr:hypothetical protein [Comamonadaceae bacterium]
MAARLRRPCRPGHRQSGLRHQLRGGEQPGLPRRRLPRDGCATGGRTTPYPP